MNITTQTNDRVVAVGNQLRMYWIQAGRKPDEDALMLMAKALEVDLPGWITPDYINSAIRNVRLKKKTLPASSDILDECERIRECAKTTPQRPAVMQDREYEEASSKLHELVNARVGRIMGFAPHIPMHFVEFVRNGLESPITDMERAAFLDLLRQSVHHGLPIECHIRSIREYGLTLDQAMSAL